LPEDAFLNEGNEVMMSLRTHEVNIGVTCPACKGQGMFHTWDCIDGTDDTAMRQRVLTDEGLFFYECPHCHSQIHMESPCLYINKEDKWMVWHIPDPKSPVTSAEVCTFLGEDSFEEYLCRSALTWGEWREKIIEMESGRDDRLYEIIKYGAYHLIKEEDKKLLPLEAFHVDYADETRQADALALVFLRKDKKGLGYTYPVTPKLLEVTSDIFSPILQRLPNMNSRGRFDRFGYAWAEQLMQYILKAASSGQQGANAYNQLLGFWVQQVGQEIFHAEVRPPQ
jgi:hypothetical protein